MTATKSIDKAIEGDDVEGLEWIGQAAGDDSVGTVTLPDTPIGHVIGARLLRATPDLKIVYE